MRGAAVLVVALLTGCAYFNGVYNARRAEKRGDAQSKRGQDAEAIASYGIAAAKAESVLARYPRGRWADDALYLAGRAAALGARCETAVDRLQSYLKLSRQPELRRQRAELALGVCFAQQGRHVAARALIAPLVTSSDPHTAATAALWAARTAVAAGARDTAAAILRSALTRSSLPRASLARVHLALAQLEFDSPNDSTAREHLVLAERLGHDSATGRQVAALLTRLDLRATGSVQDIENVLKRMEGRTVGTPPYQRLREHLLLLKILARDADSTGASLFLAAEVARDSLGATRVANALFKQVATAYARSPLAPKALLAAAVTDADSAAAYRERVRTAYPSSPYAAILSATGAASSASFALEDAQLQRAWSSALAAVADSSRRVSSPVGASGDVPETAKRDSTARPVDARVSPSRPP